MTDLPEWALRAGRVLRVSDVADLADDEAVITLSCRGFDTRTTRELVDGIVGEVTRIVVNLYPRWLDDDEPSDTRNVLDVAAAEVRARRLCRDSDNFAPFVIALARAAAGGTAYRRTEPVEVRWAGLMRLLRRAYRRDAVVVYLTPDAAVGTVATAAEWLAHHGGVAVWLDDRPGLDRYSLLRTVEPHVTEIAQPQPSAVTISRCAGMPAPHSAAEQHLERALARCEWAAQRRWNRGVAGLGSLAPTIIADLHWSVERVVVEVDGPDHRAPAKYSADRIRDNILQESGFMVLRYTNEQVLDDVDVVVAGLRRVIATRTVPS
ncbi:DUF559 domain-containing protein [Gordonia sp. TBRC 11910]|uniref:DUF559 domain-containing protein n=1 Tax=Gordonia asplenii TaxID=2725283 RepID=A0A848KQ90_9ACTN|nr:DUF559 domain-containing protein [Gordonia asplenii]NMO00117.1 DUF559 domain-containing protein [Gordonia asplenii]